MALSTSSDKFHRNIQSFIIENFIQPCELGYEDFPTELDTNNFESIACAVLFIFRDEKIKNYNRLHINVQTEEKIFEDWCQGLPSVLNTDWYLKPCVDTYKELLEISDKQMNTYKDLYTEEHCEKSITHLVFNELYRAETNSLYKF